MSNLFLNNYFFNLKELQKKWQYTVIPMNLQMIMVGNLILNKYIINLNKLNCIKYGFIYFCIFVKKT